MAISISLILAISMRHMGELTTGRPDSLQQSLVRDRVRVRTATGMCNSLQQHVPRVRL